MAIHIVRLGSARHRSEGVRLGTVRRPPRGVRREDYSSGNYYDLWLPDLAPSAELLSWITAEPITTPRWAAFRRRYRREMRTPAPGRLIALLAMLSRSTNFSVGCYCEDESRCHRSILRELLAEAGAVLDKGQGKRDTGLGDKGEGNEERVMATMSTEYTVFSIGRVRSPLTRRAGAPRQGWEGAPDAWLEIEPAFVHGLDRMKAGQEIVILTWLHEAKRDVLLVHPRDDRSVPLTGVFATRSPDRPNPIGLHRVKLLSIEEGPRLHVEGLEAIDGTPIIDIKPVLERSSDF